MLISKIVIFNMSCGWSKIKFSTIFLLKFYIRQNVLIYGYVYKICTVKYMYQVLTQTIIWYEFKEN